MSERDQQEKQRRIEAQQRGTAFTSGGSGLRRLEEDLHPQVRLVEDLHSQNLLLLCVL
jgi:hypothetical protein